MKIVIGDPTKGIAPKGKKAGRADLVSRRVRDEHGKLVTTYAVDVQSGTLANDMFTIFRRNVARARRETREILKKNGIAAE
jgi:hypothetical protein